MHLPCLKFQVWYPVHSHIGERILHGYCTAHAALDFAYRTFHPLPSTTVLASYSELRQCLQLLSFGTSWQVGQIGQEATDALAETCQKTHGQQDMMYVCIAFFLGNQLQRSLSWSRTLPTASSIYTAIMFISSSAWAFACIRRFPRPPSVYGNSIASCPCPDRAFDVIWFQFIKVPGSPQRSELHIIKAGNIPAEDSCVCVCWPVRGWRKNEIACEDTNTKQRDSICRQIYRSCAVVSHRKSDLENVHDMFFVEWWPVSFRDITSALGISTLLLFWCKPPPCCL